MAVVNVKVAYIRPQYNNLKQWMSNQNNVYIGRKGIVFIDDTQFANPYKVGKDGTRQQVIKKYRELIQNKIQNKPGFVQQLKNLVGKNLGCWCKPSSCHGDILLQYINKYKQQ